MGRILLRANENTPCINSLNRSGIISLYEWANIDFVQHRLDHLDVGNIMFPDNMVMQIEFFEIGIAKLGHLISRGTSLRLSSGKLDTVNFVFANKVLQRRILRDMTCPNATGD